MTSNDLQYTTEILKIEQSEPPQKYWINSGAPEGLAVPSLAVCLWL